MPVPTFAFFIGTRGTGKSMHAAVLKGLYPNAIILDKDDFSETITTQPALFSFIPMLKQAVNQDTIYDALIKTASKNITNTNNMAILQGNFAKRFVDGKIKIEDICSEPYRLIIIHIKCDVMVQYKRVCNRSYHKEKDKNFITSIEIFKKDSEQLAKAESEWLKSIRNKIHYLELNNTENQNFNNNVKIMESFIRSALKTPPLAPAIPLLFTPPPFKLSPENSSYPNTSPVRSDINTVGFRSCKIYEQIEPADKTTHKRSLSNILSSYLFPQTEMTESKSPRVRHADTANEDKVVIELDNFFDKPKALTRPSSDGAIHHKNTHKLSS